MHSCVRAPSLAVRSWSRAGSHRTNKPTHTCLTKALCLCTCLLTYRKLANELQINANEPSPFISRITLCCISRCASFGDWVDSRSEDVSRCLQVTSQTSTEPPSKSFYKTLFGLSHWCHKELSVHCLSPSNNAGKQCLFQFVRVCSRLGSKVLVPEVASEFRIKT